MEKYDFSEQDAKEMSEFLVPIFDYMPDKRPTAAQCLSHPWISSRPRLLQPQVKSSDRNITEEKKDRAETEVTEVEQGNTEIAGMPKLMKK